MATTDWLLLRLPAHEDAPMSWAAADESGQLISLPSADTGAGLHTLSTGRRVALVVPGEQVSQFQVALPAGNEARLLALAPFALEDQVSEDVDLLHFAVGSRDPATGLVPVAVVDKSCMESWLARAASLQLLPRAVFAEGDLAPLLPGHVTMLLTGEQLLLRNDTARPMLLPASDPKLALEMLLGAGTDLATVHLVVHASPEDWDQHAPAIEPLRDVVATFKVQLGSGGLLSLYAQGLAQSSPVNLLQGAYRPQRTQTTSWSQWRQVASLAAALLVLHVGASLWELWQARKGSAALDQDIARVFESIYPGQQPGSDPRRALERRLAELSGQSGQNSQLMYMLAAVAAARQNVPVAQLRAITFETGSLRLRLGAPDAATLESFSQALRAAGYTADVASGSQRDGAYEGQVDMKVQGS